MRAFSGHRNPKSGTSHGGSAPAAATYKKWRNLMLLFVFFVVVAEIAFLGRLDIAKNAAIVKSWTGSFYRGSPERETAPQDVRLGRLKVFGLDGNSDVDGCKKWLEREDAVEYSRDFDADPILVSGDAQEWKTCAVGCKFRSSPSTNPDATFDSIESSKVPRVLRSMESSAYYAVNDVAEARRWVVLLQTSLWRNDIFIVIKHRLGVRVAVGGLGEGRLDFSLQSTPPWLGDAWAVLRRLRGKAGTLEESWPNQKIKIK